MNPGLWRKEPMTGRIVRAAPHLLTCPECEGAGAFTDRHPHDPAALDVKCERCDGEGQVRCDDDGCCDYEPPEDDE